MNGETRIHLVVVGVGAATLGLVLLFWIWPRLIIYGVLGLAAVLAYGALYLIIAAWVDPKRPPEAPPKGGGSDTPTVIEPSEDEPTRAVSPVDDEAETQTRLAIEDAPTEVAPPAKKKARKTKRKTKKKKAGTRSKARKAKPADEDS